MAIILAYGCFGGIMGSFHHYQVRFLGFDMQDRIMESSCQGSSS